MTDCIHSKRLSVLPAPRLSERRLKASAAPIQQYREVLRLACLVAASRRFAQGTEGDELGVQLVHRLDAEREQFAAGGVIAENAETLHAVSGHEGTEIERAPVRPGLLGVSSFFMTVT